MEKKTENEFVDIIKGFSDFVEQEEKEVINKMVDVMMLQRDVMTAAAKNGINVNDLMDKIKAEYEERIESLTKEGKII